jgi:hypothetical protein
MKTKIYLLALLFASVAGMKAQSVTYRITKDDPYDIKNFSLAIDPLFMDISGQNGFSGGWGLRADYLMGKRLQANFDMRNAFGTVGHDVKDPYNNTRNYFYMEGALGLVLSHREVSKNVPIILSQSTSGNYRYTVSISGGVPATMRKMIMLRGGVYQMTNTINLKGLADSLTYFDPKSGGEKRTLAAMDSLGFLNGTKKDAKYGGFASTAIFGGFNFKTICQLYLDVDGYGERGNIRYNDFFIDGIFAPVVTLKNYTTIDTTGTDTKIEYDIKSKDKRMFGWRMGWVYRKPKDQGFSMKFEFGQRPGYKMYDSNGKESYLKGMYAMFTFGLYIPLKVQPFYGG